MGDSLSPPAKAPKKKKALAFLKSTRKPALDANAGNGDEDQEQDDLAMFQRSKSFFPIVVKEQEEPRDATPEPTTEGRLHATDDDDDEPLPSSERASKRRRVSSPRRVVDAFRESSEDLYGPATPPPRVSEPPKTSPPKSQVEESTASSDRPPKQSISSTRKGDEKEEIKLVRSDVLPTPSRSNSHQLSADSLVVLDHEDDPFKEGVSSRPSRRAKASSTPIKGDGGSPIAIALNDSDDDLIETVPEPKEDKFAYFVKRAAEREAAAKAAEVSHLASGDEFDETSTPDGSGPRPKKCAPGVPVKLFVFCRLDGIELDRPFGSKRRLNQDLGTVRRAFCQWVRNQGIELSDDMERNTFLTWKDRRIYDSASGVTLGWQPHAESGFHGNNRQLGFTRGGILLEAWTEEGFARHQAEEERQKLVDRGELPGEGNAADDDDGEGAGEQQEQEPPKIRLFLKEKDREPLRLTVWVDMPVRILAGAYRKQREIPPDREIRLRHEGEWLTPDMTIQQADVDDMMTIEVYLK